MAMKKIDTRGAIAPALRKGMEKTEHSEISASEDGFTIVQPFDDLNAVVVTVENNTGNHPVNTKVTNTVAILERQEGTLDVFRQKVGDKTPQKSCKEKSMIFSGKGYYVTREDTCNVGPYIFSENKMLLRGYFNAIEAALPSLVTNSLLVNGMWTMNPKNYREPILEMKEQIISDAKQYSIEQASNSLDDLGEDKLFD